jgi:hypothetical protein
VEHGSPAGQLNGFGAQWKTKVNVEHVAGPNSPIEDVTLQEARDHYPLGPPYMATAKDMYKIAEKWCEFLPKVMITIRICLQKCLHIHSQQPTIVFLVK